MSGGPEGCGHTGHLWPLVRTHAQGAHLTSGGGPQPPLDLGLAHSPSRARQRGAGGLTRSPGGPSGPGNPCRPRGPCRERAGAAGPGPAAPGTAHLPGAAEGLWYIPQNPASGPAPDSRPGSWWTVPTPHPHLSNTSPYSPAAPRCLGCQGARGGRGHPAGQVGGVSPELSPTSPSPWPHPAARALAVRGVAPLQS